jgi:hypothetical protein
MQTELMGDIAVNESEWIKLHDELRDLRDDADKINSYMLQHGRKIWKVW